MKLITRTFIVIGIVLSMTLASVYAQTGTGGSISVTVTDPSGASIPDAALEIQNQETNDTHKAATGGSGTFVFPNLPFGIYRLQVSKTGFSTRVFQSVEVQTGRVTDIPV